MHPRDKMEDRRAKGVDIGIMGVRTGLGEQGILVNVVYRSHTYLFAAAVDAELV